jgi:hypothetical protein
VPQVIALALLGAGLYAGYRWFARAAGGIGATIARAKDAPRQQSQGRIVKDLGALEYDPASGVYRPAKRD